MPTMNECSNFGLYLAMILQCLGSVCFGPEISLSSPKAEPNTKQAINTNTYSRPDELASGGADTKTLSSTNVFTDGRRASARGDSEG